MVKVKRRLKTKDYILEVSMPKRYTSPFCVCLFNKEDADMWDFIKHLRKDESITITKLLDKKVAADIRGERLAEWDYGKS